MIYLLATLPFLAIIAVILYFAFKIDPDKCSACGSQLDVWDWRNAQCVDAECKLFRVKQ